MVEIPGFIDKAQGHKFTVACDVTTTFRDATRIFSPQKGARAEDLPILEKRLSEYADIILQKTGIDVNELPGSGAAGGLGGAFAAWLGADLVPGIEMVLEAVGFDKMLEGVDLIITGEGRSDYQTVKGKTPWGILKHASAKKIPTVLMSGIIEVCPEFERFVKCIQITPANQTLSEAIQPENARRNIIQALSQNREWFE